MPQGLPKTPIKTDSLFTPMNQTRDLRATLSQMGSDETWWQAGSFMQMILLKVLYAVIILFVFWLISRACVTVLKRLFARTNVNEGVQQLVLKFVKLTLMIFGIVTALGEFVNVTPMLAGIGVIGIAVGFAAQDTIQNFISGLTILIDQPFKIGDNIIVDGTFGTVQEITLRSTRVRTLNHEIVILPNNQMINQKLINHTSLETLRIELPFSIAYAESIPHARAVALSTTKGDTRFLDNPAPSVIVKSLADSAITMSLRMWLVNPKEEVPIKDEYIEKIREALREASIEIPFPQLTVHIDQGE